MQYRVRESGEVRNQGEIRRLHRNTSFPRVWDDSVCDAIGIDPVLASPKPEVTNLQHVLADGVEQDALGNWMDKWIIADKFSDHTDDEGVVHTKAEQETAFLQAEADKAWANLRGQRAALLVETDHYALQDVDLSDEMKIYRQALRDLPENVDINDPVFPEKP